MMSSKPLKSSRALIARCVAIVGGQSALARKANQHLAPNVRPLTQADIYKWLNKRQTPAPPDIYVRAVELAVGGIVTRYEMRPDIFGEAPDEEPRSAA